MVRGQNSCRESQSENKKSVKNARKELKRRLEVTHAVQRAAVTEKLKEAEELMLKHVHKDSKHQILFIGDCGKQPSRLMMPWH